MLKLIYAGMKRRKNETRYVSLVTYIAVLFMTGITLFQGIMNDYIFSNNLYNYGDWVISSVNRKCQHPYLLTESSVTTGTNIVDEEGIPLQTYTGKVDENFKSLYEELLYEGRMPEQEDEVAVDISTLAVLGYSYELGQMVEISTMDEDGVISSKTYELVGTLKNFSSIWKNAATHSLPSILLTDKAFEAYQTGGYTTYFYQLNPQYNEISTYEFAESFIPKDESAITNPVIYNEYVYENKVWGSAKMFDNVTRAIMLIAAVAIGYLLMSYTDKRRETYYRYRCIGATKWQVRGIVLLECLTITLPQILFGLFSAYVGAVAGCQLAQWYQIDVVYQFDIRLLAEQVLVALVVVALALAATQLSVNDKRLAGNTGQVKPAKFRILRKIASRVKKPEKSIFLRQDILHPIQKCLASVFTVLMFGCLILCVFKIYHQWKYSNDLLGAFSDFTMTYDEMEEYSFEISTSDGNIYMTSFTPSDMSLGVGEEMLEAIEMSPGVKSWETYWIDETHYFQWEGMEACTAVQYLEEQIFYGTPLEYGMRMEFYENVNALQNYLSEENLEYLQEKQIDWEAVEKGEQVILLVNANIGESNICAGDTLDILHFEDGYVMSVRVADVVEQDASEGSYWLIGTKALAEKMMAAEEKALKYSYIKVMYDSTASYESTDKQLASCAVNNGFSYSSFAERRRMEVEELLQAAGIYGALFVVILVVFVTLHSNFLMNQLKYMQEKYVTLRRLGMEEKQYIHYAAVAQAKRFLWLIPGMVFGYFLIYCERYIFHKVSGTSPGLISYAVKVELSAIEDHWFILLMVLLYLFMTGTSIVRIKKFVERGK